MDKQGMIDFILTNGKDTLTWLELCNKFELGEGLTDSQKSKKANDIWRTYVKKENRDIDNFASKSKIKGVKRWQNADGKWLKSVSYEATPSQFNSEAFKTELVKAIAEYELPSFKPIYTDYNKLCAVINLYDAHISKLCLKSETGEESDTDSAISLFEKSFDELLTTTKAFSPEIIVFPIGNDFFHENAVSGTTKKGTRLDVSGNHFDNFTKGLSLIRKCIDKASTVARVYVPLIVSNHDEDVSIYMATALAEIYKENKNVEIDDRRISRKYFRYGTNLIGFTHGHLTKAEQLPLIMAVEKPQAFAETTERIWLTGHFHSLATKEFPGVTVRTLRGLTSPDKWHFDSGYVNAKKSANVMIFEEKNGLKAEFSTNIK